MSAVKDLEKEPRYKNSRSKEGEMQLEIVTESALDRGSFVPVAGGCRGTSPLSPLHLIFGSAPAI